MTSIQVSRLCRCRHFYSKGSFLVLLWVFLLSTAAWMLATRMFQIFFTILNSLGLSYPLVVGLVLLFITLAPVLGWLADTKWGNYAVFKAGCILCFFASMLFCISLLVVENCNNNTACMTASGVIVSLGFPLALLGLGAGFGQALHLGLDQMPDGSSDNITSFIAWFLFALFLGFWTSDFLYYVPMQLISSVSPSQKVQIISTLAAICTAAVCCTIFLLAPKWLIIEPNAPQSLKTIYRVLKFAARHKAPLNRSALTYWEEDIPSRLDLGKSKYGGPFTTEQVEDVKTFFKILIIHISFFTTNLAINFWLVDMQNNSNSSQVYIYLFTYSPWWVILVATVTFEFVIYPWVRNKIPSTLTRIGLVSFGVLITNAVYLVINIVNHAESYNLSYTIAFYVLFGLKILFLLSAMLEFVCAQSPYNMRGLLTGYTAFVYCFAEALGGMVNKLFDQFYNYENRDITAFSIATILSLFGFLLHCVLARWYKRRVRDEDYSVHRVVEEVYDRYLTQAAQNR